MTSSRMVLCFQFAFLLFYVLNNPFQCERFAHKKRNLLFHGVIEPPDETPRALADRVVHVLNDVMKANVSLLTEVDNFYRIGEPTPPGRTLVVRMLYAWQKEEILELKSTLVGTGMTVENDTRPIVPNATHSYEDEYDVNNDTDINFYLIDQRNFLLYGLDDVTMDDDNDQVKESVMRVLTKDLKVDDLHPAEIFCYRVVDKDRREVTVMVKCLTQWRKNDLMAHAGNLNGTKYSLALHNHGFHCGKK